MMGRKRLVPGASAIYLFNEGSGTTLHDYSGNGNHGTLGAGAAAPTWTQYGLSFDGGDLVQLARQTYAGAFSIQWVASRTGTADYEYVFGDTGDTTCKFGYGSVSTRLYVRVGGTDIAVPTTHPAGYHSVTITRDGAGAVALGVDGAVAANFTAGGSITLNRIGVDAGGKYFIGTLCAGLIYPFALTPAQVAQNHAALKGLLAPRGVALA